MTCKILQNEELRDALIEGRQFYQMPPNPTQDDIDAALQHSAANLVKSVIPEADQVSKQDDKIRYHFLGFLAEHFKERVTHRVARKFEKGKTLKQLQDINDRTEVQREGGTFVHDTAENIGRHLVSVREGGVDDISAIKARATDTTQRFHMEEKHFDNMVEGMKDIVSEVYAKQEEINKVNDTTGKVKIYFETPIASSSESVAGTMDFLAVFSNGDAMIYDYKTMSPKGQHYNSKGELTSDGFIYASKKEQWKLQQGTYKRILLRDYGVRNVLATRIVPIWAKWSWDMTTRRFTETIEKVEMGHNTEFLRQVAATYEKTGIRDLDKLLTAKQKRIESLKQKVRQAGKADKEVLNNRIKAAEESVIELILRSDLSDLVNETASLVDDAVKRLDKMSVAQLRDVLTEARMLTDFAETINFNHQAAANAKRATVQKIKESLAESTEGLDAVKAVMGRLQAELANKVLNEIEASFGNLGRDEDNIVKLKEDGWFTRRFGRTSQFQNPFIQQFNKLKDEAIYDRNKAFEAFNEELAKHEDALVSWGASQGLKYQDVIDKYFVVTDSSKASVQRHGEHLVTRMTTAFFEERSRRAEEDDNQWFFENYEVRDMEKYAKNFAETLATVRQEAKVTYPNSSEKQKRIVDGFLKRNSLQLTNGRPKYPEAWRNKAMRGYLKPKQATAQRYMSPEFKVISQIPALLSYYEFLEKANNDFRSSLGVEFGDVPSYFLPNVRASFLEKLSLSDVGSGFEEMRQVFNIRQDDTLFGHMNETTGEFEKRVPIYFVSAFKDSSGNAKLGEKSLDLGKSYLQFAKMAYTHKYMSQIEAQVLALKDVMSTNAEFLKKDTAGRQLIDFMGNDATQEIDGSTDTEKVFNALIDYYLYGVRMQTKGFTVKSGLFKGVNSTKAILRMKNYMSLKSLGLGIIPAASGYMAAQAQAYTEGKKGLVYTSDQWKTSRQDMSGKNGKVAQEKYFQMGFFFNVHADDVLGMAKRTNEKPRFRLLEGDPTERSGWRKYMSNQLLMSPFKYGDERVDNHITNAMSRNYGVDSNGNLKRLANLPEGTPSLYDMIEVVDDKVVIKGYEDNPEGLKKISIAFKNAVRVAQQGIKGSMSEEDINYAQTDLAMNLMLQFKTWLPGIVHERFGAIKYNRFTDVVHEGRHRALANEFTTEDAASAYGILRMAADNTGRILADMATFGYMSYKPNEARAKKSYDRWIQENPRWASVSFQEFLKGKQAAIRASIAELRVIFMVASLLFVLGADWDDDGKPLYKDNWVLHKTYQLLSRTYTELASFAPLPQASLEWTKTIAKPFAVIAPVQDAAKVLINTVDVVHDYFFGDKNDKSPAFYYTSKMIPGAYQLRRLFNIFEQDEKATR